MEGILRCNGDPKSQEILYLFCKTNSNFLLLRIDRITYEEEA
jgi:hypothetical protein